MSNILTHQFKNRKIRVGRISYMNVAPVYYGFDTQRKPRWMDMTWAPPSTLNRMLAREELDISPVSSAAYAMNSDKWLLLPGLSIACYGRVMSVLLVSKHPFGELSGKRVMLTEESETAAGLVKLMLGEKGATPFYETVKLGNPREIRDNADAALVIGDAALKKNWGGSFSHVRDLGELWKEMTGLPFVFALWAVRKKYAKKYPERVASVLEEFQSSRKSGLKNISKIIPVASKKLGIDRSLCKEYYDLLNYDLNPPHLKGLEAFFAGLYAQKILPEPVSLSFFREGSPFFQRECAA